MNLTVVIPSLAQTKEQRYSLEQCVTSLHETVPDIPKIVAFNGGWMKKDERYKSMFLEEQGQCRAVNAAVASTNTEWIMVTNDDMIYPPGWFEYVSSWDKTFFNPDRLSISPILVEPTDGAPTFVKHFCGGAGGDFDKQKFLDFVANMDKNQKATRSGFNLPFIMKREFWDLIGGYDINYDPWSSNSDSDLEYKIKLAGGQSIQMTNWYIYHFSQTSGTFHPDHRDAWQRNWDYFIEKWGFPRTDDGIWTADFEIPYDQLKYRPKWAVIPGKEAL